MRFFSTFLILLAIITNVTVVQAEYKIATVNINKVLNSSKLAQEKKASFEKLSSQEKQGIEKEKDKLVALEKTLKDKNVAQDSKEADEFRQKVRDFQRAVKDKEEELKKKFMEINSLLAKNSLATVSQYAKANNIDLVLESFEDSETGPLLYHEESHDITDQVISMMNK